MSGDERPAEVRVLDRYVGTWLNDLVTFPTKSYPEPAREVIIEQTGWEFTDVFIQAQQMNVNTGLKSLWLITPNEADRLNFTFWFFDNSGYIDLWKCHWLAQGEMMLLDDETPPPGVSRATSIHCFAANGSYFGTMSGYDDKGERVIYLQGGKTRQQKILGVRMIENWEKHGVPAAPLPEQLRYLDRMVGTWKEEVEYRLPTDPSRGSSLSGEISARWVLDGWFLLFDDHIGDYRAEYLATYDPVHGSYRFFMFTNTGRFQQFAGSRDKDGFNLKSVPDHSGNVTTLSVEICGPDLIKTHVLTESRGGEKLVDKLVTWKRTSSQPQVRRFEIEMETPPVLPLARPPF